jgi:hypothetical protein
VITQRFGITALIFFLDSRELCLHGLLFFLHGALALVGNNSSIPVLVDRRESLRGSRGRPLNDANGATLVKAIGASFSIVNPDISNGQVGIKIEVLLRIIEDFLNRKGPTNQQS